MSLKCILQGQDSKNLVTKVELNEHIADKNNPHEVTAEQVGAYLKATIDEKLTHKMAINGYITDNTNIDTLSDGVYFYNGWAQATFIHSFPLPFINASGIWIRKTPYNAEQLDEAQQDIVIRTDKNIIYTRTGKTMDWIKSPILTQLCNPNLLDNWYFGSFINQRNGYIVPAGVDYYTFTWEKVGQTDKDYQVLLRRNAANNYDCEIEINGTRYVVGGADTVPGYCVTGYSIDRWKFTTDGGNVAISNGYLDIYSTRQYGSYLEQKIDPELAKALAGKTVTYSVLAAEGDTAFSANMNKNGSYVDSFPIEPNTVSCKTWTFPTDSTDVLFTFAGNAAGHVRPIAAKLELGDTQTLAHKEGDKWVLNEIPDYGEQLRRCTYYAEKVEDIDTPAITNSTFIPSGATSAVFILPYARKRTIPAINFNDVSNYRVIARSISGETTAFSMTSISLLDIGRTKAAILVSFNATDQGYYCFLQRSDNAPAGYAFISADL